MGHAAIDQPVRARRATAGPDSAVEGRAAPAEIGPDASRRMQDHFGNSVVLQALGGADVGGMGRTVAEALAAGVDGVDTMPESLDSNAAMQLRLRARDAGSGPALAAIPTGGGVAMAPRLRATMERAFDHDFGHVRLHADAAAAAATDRLNAHAMALGADIFFGAGEFAPGTADGDRLLAHELTHVVQHDEGRLVGTGVSSPSDPTEVEAYANEQVILDRIAAPELGPADAPAVQPSGAAPATVMRDGEGYPRQLELFGSLVTYEDGAFCIGGAPIPGVGDLVANATGAAGGVIGAMLGGYSTQWTFLDTDPLAGLGLAPMSVRLLGHAGFAGAARPSKIVPKGPATAAGFHAAVRLDLSAALSLDLGLEASVGWLGTGGFASGKAFGSGQIRSALVGDLHWTEAKGWWGHFGLEDKKSPASITLGGDVRVGTKFLSFQRDGYVLELAGLIARTDLAFDLGVGRDEGAATSWTCGMPSWSPLTWVTKDPTANLEGTAYSEKLSTFPKPEALELAHKNVLAAREKLAALAPDDEQDDEAAPSEEGPKPSEAPKLEKPASQPGGIWARLGDEIYLRAIHPTATIALPAAPAPAKPGVDLPKDDKAETYFAWAKRKTGSAATGIAQLAGYCLPGPQMALTTVKNQLKAGNLSWVSKIEQALTAKTFELGPSLSIAVTRALVTPNQGLTLDTKVDLHAFGEAGASTADLKLQWDVFHTNALHQKVVHDDAGFHIQKVPTWRLLSDELKVGKTLHLVGLEAADGHLKIARGLLQLALPSAMSSGAPGTISGYVEDLVVGDEISWGKLGGSLDAAVKLGPITVSSVAVGADKRAEPGGLVFAGATLAVADVFGHSLGARADVGWNLSDKSDFVGSITEVVVDGTKTGVDLLFSKDGFLIPRIGGSLDKMIEKTGIPKSILTVQGATASIEGLSIAKDGLSFAKASGAVAKAELGTYDGKPVVELLGGTLDLTNTKGGPLDVKAAMDALTVRAPYIGGELTGKGGTFYRTNGKIGVELALVTFGGFTAKTVEYDEAASKLSVAAMSVATDKLVTLGPVTVTGGKAGVTGLERTPGNVTFAAATVGFTELSLGKTGARLVIAAPTLTVEGGAKKENETRDWGLTGTTSLDLLGMTASVTADLRMKGGKIDRASSLTDFRAGGLSFQKATFVEGGFLVEKPALALETAGLDAHKGLLPDWMKHVPDLAVKIEAESYDSSKSGMAAWTGISVIPTKLKLDVPGLGVVGMTVVDGVATVVVPDVEKKFSAGVDAQVPLLYGLAGLHFGASVEVGFGLKGMSLSGSMTRNPGMPPVLTAQADLTAFLSLAGRLEAGLYAGVPFLSVMGGVYGKLGMTVEAATKAKMKLVPGNPLEFGLDLGVTGEAVVKAEAGAFVGYKVLGWAGRKDFPIADKELARIGLEGQLGWGPDGLTAKGTFPTAKMTPSSRLDDGSGIDEKALKDERIAAGSKRADLTETANAQAGPLALQAAQREALDSKLKQMVIANANRDIAWSELDAAKKAEDAALVARKTMEADTWDQQCKLLVPAIDQLRTSLSRTTADAPVAQLKLAEAMRDIAAIDFIETSRAKRALEREISVRQDVIAELRSKLEAATDETRPGIEKAITDEQGRIAAREALTAKFRTDLDASGPGAAAKDQAPAADAAQKATLLQQATRKRTDASAAHGRAVAAVKAIADEKKLLREGSGAEDKYAPDLRGIAVELAKQNEELYKARDSFWRKLFGLPTNSRAEEALDKVEDTERMLEFYDKEVVKHGGITIGG